jgi:pimeloyl-ACP methyl ester carboxylesterase
VLPCRSPRGCGNGRPAAWRPFTATLARGAELYREASAAVVVDEFLEARWPGYRPGLERVLPGALAQAVADAGTWFEHELPGLLDWQFGEAEARHIKQPVLSVLGGTSEALEPRFGETHRLLLTWLPRAKGVVLPGTAHLLHLENPHGIAEALAAFWARL